MHWPHHQSPGLRHNGPLSSCESTIGLYTNTWRIIINKLMGIYTPIKGFPLFGIITLYHSGLQLCKITCLAIGILPLAIFSFSTPRF
jgi:hypothetical protein